MSFLDNKVAEIAASHQPEYLNEAKAALQAEIDGLAGQIADLTSRKEAMESEITEPVAEEEVETTEEAQG